MSGFRSELESPEVAVNIDEDTLQFTILRSQLRDALGAPPFPGRSLENFVASSYGNRLTRGDANFNGDRFDDGHWSDRMPNLGVAGPLILELGVQQDGALAQQRTVARKQRGCHHVCVQN